MGLSQLKEGPSWPLKRQAFLSRGFSVRALMMPRREHTRKESALWGRHPRSDGSLADWAFRDSRTTRGSSVEGKTCRSNLLAGPPLMRLRWVNEFSVFLPSQRRARQLNSSSAREKYPMEML